MHSAIKQQFEFQERMIPARHRYRYTLVMGLFLASALLVPLKTVFACAMMDSIVERCCCDHAHEADCRSQPTEVADCCDSFYLPEAKSDSLSTFNKVFTAQRLDAHDLPPLLPPREVGADPPALSDTSRSHYLSIPPAWLQGSQTYLLTLRLRN